MSRQLSSLALSASHGLGQHNVKLLLESETLSLLTLGVQSSQAGDGVEDLSREVTERCHGP